MTTATRAHPELIGRPRPIRRRIAHLHLRAAPHAADVEIDVAHAGDSITWTAMIPAIVLAAGRSSRMGRAKATLPDDRGEAFLSRIVRTLTEAGVDDVLVVLGHEAEAIAGTFAASDLRARFVVNHRYDRGQLSSLQAGLAVADRPGVAAVMVTLVDVPLVTAATVRAVLDRYRQTRAQIVRPVNGSRHGHPLVIDRALFDAIRGADDDTGAKPVVRAHVSPQGDVIVDDEGAFTDIDTMDAYRRLFSDRSAGSDGDSCG
jgi:molybdenum cofactor cytidylyltransferase